jgi:SHS2 domain-containing protein
MEAFTPLHLTACVSGGPTVEKTIVVKAATYHNLSITRSDAGLEATIVYDI